MRQFFTISQHNYSGIGQFSENSCRKRPKIVTVTETQQLCGKEFQEMRYRTTKMCITHEHDTDHNNLVGEWKCLDFEHLYQRCLSFNVKKQIRSEITRGDQHTKLECTHKGNSII